MLLPLLNAGDVLVQVGEGAVGLGGVEAQQGQQAAPTGTRVGAGGWRLGGGREGGWVGGRGPARRVGRPRQAMGAGHADTSTPGPPNLRPLPACLPTHPEGMHQPTHPAHLLLLSSMTPILIALPKALHTLPYFPASSSAFFLPSSLCSSLSASLASAAGGGWVGGGRRCACAWGGVGGGTWGGRSQAGLGLALTLPAH